MLALKRLLHFTSQNNNSGLTMFDQLVSDLQVSITQRLALDPDELNGWPEGRWAVDAKEAKASQWQDDTQYRSRLLELDWSESVDGCIWRLKLNLACSAAGPIIMEETWWADTTRRALPYEDLPAVTQFAGRLEPLNRDGLPAAKALVLGADRLNAFREYLLSPTRALPVVVFSPRINGEERALATELAHQLMGAAIVLRFESTTQSRFDEIMAPRSCYKGAIRLYMPGYQVTDQQWRHPYWQTAVDPIEAKREIIDRVARESMLLDQHPEIVQLRERRDQSRRSEAEALRRQAREDKHARLKAETSAEEYQRYFDVLAQDNDELTGDNEALRALIREKDDQIRQLEWRINQQWSKSIDYSEATPTEEKGTILISRQAQTAYSALDQDERDYWDRQLFPKLLQPELRNNQTRKMKSKGAPCFVYPRKRTADGRRVIFYCDESNVFVCEIFTGAQHDSDYDRLNTTGVDREAYDGFVDLSEVSGDAAQ